MKRMFQSLILALALVSLSVIGCKDKDLNEQRLQDLQTIKMALEARYKETGNYPNSGGNWDGLASQWGDSKEVWIDDMVPKYLSKLPRDPRINLDKKQQYLYMSDGKDYKLISHGPENCEKVKKEKPERIDPKRDCWAFGYWTEGGKSF